MYLITLKFAANKASAPDHLDAHKAWIARGFEDGIFLMTGTIEPQAGGVVLAHNVDRAALEARVGEDPFVAEGIVSAEIIGVAPGRTDDRLAFLKA
ncbi:hypothetical protein DLJ53_09565 [Acuticoccus sediminis]|uniref:YCII-related domain-containing protein n=1 Tax=Acuticoccus sediminis TaxID=2184697 RepID=A0A8B2NV96_9HYPH|nr:hypothetical protein [Acuticoccus sediminis]RAI01653.1 hypothetical protein DLJ53_09565 [Acuticoccus sediminis]